MRRSQSLLLKWLAINVAIAVVIVSLTTYFAWYYAQVAVAQQVQTRLCAVAHVLRRPNFPLNHSVLESIGSLSQMEFVLVDKSNQLLDSTLAEDVAMQLIGYQSTPPTDSLRTIDTNEASGIWLTAYENAEFVGGWIAHLPFNEVPVSSASDQNRGRRLGLFIEREQIDATRREAAALPIITGGLLTIAFALASVISFSRIVSRIKAIEQHVNEIGRRRFVVMPSDRFHDELSRLSSGINRMAADLERSEKELQTAERDRLLSQLARGIAHDLKNSLAGVRLALQMFRRENVDIDGEPLEIAMLQLATAEELLSRLAVGTTIGRDNGVTTLENIVSDAVQMVQPTLRHWRVKWSIKRPPSDDSLWRERVTIQLRSALYNLLLNAVQAAGVGGSVMLEIDCDSRMARLLVSDSGPGPDASLGAEIFEPTYSTKPEGLGLGLSVVRETASALHGTVEWKRVDDQTQFIFEFPRTNR